MSPSKVMKLITGGAEAFLGIPIIGGLFIIGNGWSPLFVMLLLHIATLVLTKKDGGSSGGSILGMITSCIGWIPLLGMVMHIITALVLFINAFTPESNVVKTM